MFRLPGTSSHGVTDADLLQREAVAPDTVSSYSGQGTSGVLCSPESPLAPLAVSSGRTGSMPPRIDNDILAERKRVGWTEATGVADRIEHKMQSLAGLRTSDDKARAFIGFMGECIGKLGTTTLDLGDGWIRATRSVGSKTALLDLRFDEDGAIVDARHPGQFPDLPLGTEQVAYSTVLAEMQARNGRSLRPVPVYYVNWNTSGYVLPTHGFVAAGNPGMGRRSGAVLYSVGGDPKRGPVTLDGHTLKRLNARARGTGAYKLPDYVRTAIARLGSAHYASREDFYNAYRQARGANVDQHIIHAEMSSVYRLLSKRTMELWPRTSGDYTVAKASASERDIRAFENPPKGFGHSVTLKQISGVRSIDLLEAKRQFLLHQLYQDERLGRNGTGVPQEAFPPTADADGQQSLVASTPRFQRLPPWRVGDKVGNCNAGAASLLQRAIDQYDGPETKGGQRATAASVFGLGAGHRIALWDPLKPRDNVREGPATASSDASLARTRLAETSTGETSGANVSTSSNAQSSIGTLTDAVRTVLADTWPSQYCHADDNALILNTVPCSEDLQKKLIRMTIGSAERFAILTSFSVNPAKDHEPGNVSGTTFAMLESLARRQDDRDFNFVLLYNDNKLQRNAVLAAVVGQNVTANMSLKSTSRVPGTITWPAVVEAYNRQQRDERLRIGNVQCGIYFVAAKAKGVAGSHHNKFCINDRGVAATLGASIANKTKDGWMDGGCIAVSTALAASQRDYFLDVLMGDHTVHCAQLRMDGDVPSMTPLRDTAPIQALAGIDVLSPLDIEGPDKASTADHFNRVLDSAGIPLEGARHKVLWIQKPSNGYRNMFSERRGIDGNPIGRAIATIFRSAVAGETIDIANKKIGCEGFSLITDALSRGCNVNVLVDRSARTWVEYAARRFYADRADRSLGRLTVKHYAPNEQLARRLNINLQHEQVLHAKNYVLTRRDGSCVVMTGSYNLDGQSHFRSNENLMLFETADANLRKTLFDDLYEGSDSAVGLYGGNVVQR